MQSSSWASIVGAHRRCRPESKFRPSSKPTADDDMLRCCAPAGKTCINGAESLEEGVPFWQMIDVSVLLQTGYARIVIKIPSIKSPALPIAPKPAGRRAKRSHRTAVTELHYRAAFGSVVETDSRNKLTAHHRRKGLSGRSAEIIIDDRRKRDQPEARKSP